MPRTVPYGASAGFSLSASGGGMLFVSGQVALDASGELVGEGDCGAQARQTFANVGQVLKAAGATWDDVVKLTAFLVDPGDYDAFAAARAEVFPESGPASSTVIVAALVRPEFLIEIEAVAAIDGSE